MSQKEMSACPISSYEAGEKESSHEIVPYVDRPKTVTTVQKFRRRADTSRFSCYLCGPASVNRYLDI